MTMLKEKSAAIARINGVAINRPDERLEAGELRQRACTELLRQAAQKEGLLAEDDESTGDGVISEAGSTAIEALLDSAIPRAAPTDEECTRYFEGNRNRYRESERVRTRHILFAVTPGVDVAALRTRAEATLLQLRCQDNPVVVDSFASAARELSNCPSGADGGALGWLRSEDCAPEFARELFGQSDVGVLPRLVHSRFGLHVVEVLERDNGRQRSFQEVAGAVREELARNHFATSLRQYLKLLAGAAEIENCDLEASDTPLVQ